MFGYSSFKNVQYGYHDKNGVLSYTNTERNLWEIYYSVVDIYLNLCLKMTVTIV